MLVIAGIVVTNDGNAILRELDLAHPAAKACTLSLSSFPSTPLVKGEIKYYVPSNGHILSTLFFAAV